MLAGCPLSRRPGPYDPLLLGLDGGPPIPEKTEARLQAADESAGKGPTTANLEYSLRCANAVLAAHPKHEAAAWRAARALYFLSELEPDKARRKELAAHCMDAAHLASASKTSAHGLYWAALCMGARAQTSNLEAIDLLPKMVEVGHAALKLDPKVMHGGPNRLLGGIYLRAPAWPTSVGDLDEALEHLEQARTIGPRWPENLLLWAEALAADDRYDEAKAAIAQAERLMAQPEMRSWAKLWQKDLKKLKARIARED